MQGKHVHLTIVVTLVVFTLVETHSRTCKRKQLDVIYILDSSTSIWAPHFTKQLEFVAKMVNFFDIGPNKTRVGVLTFSSEVTVNFGLTSHMDNTSLVEAVRKIPQKGGNTRTDKAIRHMRHLFQAERRSNCIEVALVLTDGKSLYPKRTASAAAYAHRTGIHVFAIGIGDEIDQMELANIAGGKGHVITVDSFRTLQTIAGFLASKTCHVKLRPMGLARRLQRQGKKYTFGTTPSPTNSPNPSTSYKMSKVCGGEPADIVFVLDASSSIWGPDFHRQLEFLQSVTDVFPISSNETRIGVITYGSTARKEFDLNDYSSAEELKAAIKSIRQSNGETNTAGALKFLTGNSFNETNGGRPGVARIGIVITDGQSQDPPATAQLASIARQAGIRLFAIGVGPNVDYKELESIASSPKKKYVFTVTNYQALETIKNLLAFKTCQVKSPTQTVPNPTRKTRPDPRPADQGCGVSSAADVVFIPPSTTSQRQFAQSLKFFRDIAAQMNIGPRQVHVGMVPRNCDRIPPLHLDSNLNKHGLLKKLANIRLRHTGMPAMLSYARSKSFSQYHGARLHAKKFTVILLDGNSDDLAAVKKEVAKLRDDLKVKVFVVAVGKSVSGQEIRALASFPTQQHAFFVTNYNRLVFLTRQLTRALNKSCENATPTH